MRMLFLLLTIITAVGCGTEPVTNSANSRTSNGKTANSASVLVPTYSYDIVATYPHDPAAFTQGLIFRNGVLYEGTGGYGDDPYRSSIRKVELQTGKVLTKKELAPEYFGEGIAVLGDKIYQLTWKEGKAFVYNIESFELVQEFSYSGDGWGLTEDGTNLYLSDGTHIIRVVDPATFKTTRTIAVKDERGNPVMQLNELEWVKGEIWANVWQKDWIIRIDPANGNVIGRINLEKLSEQERRIQASQPREKQPEVLNGIAYDPEGDRLFITGKLWRRVFEIKIKPEV